MKVLLHIEDKKLNSKEKVKEICPKTFQMMTFLYNSIQEGWTIEKKNETYIFRKKHEGKKEILEEGFLETFIGSNLNLEKIILR